MYARTRRLLGEGRQYSSMLLLPVSMVSQVGKKLHSDGNALTAAGLICERLQAILELSQTGACPDQKPVSQLSSMGQPSLDSARALPNRPVCPTAAAASGRPQPRNCLSKPRLAPGRRPAWNEDWAPALTEDMPAATALKRDDFSAARSSPAKQQQGVYRNWRAKFSPPV